MAELRGNRFTKYFPLLLDALRSTDPTPMRPAEARAWITARIDVPVEDLTRLIKAKSKQTIFENDVHWARFYLVKADLIAAPKRGFWGLTPQGRNTHLTPEETWDLYVRVRDANRPGATPDEEDLPAPELADNAGDDVAYWFVGAVWDSDQTARFLTEGIWENGYTEDQFSDLVQRMKAGDRIAIKASFVQKRENHAERADRRFRVTPQPWFSRGKTGSGGFNNRAPPKTQPRVARTGSGGSTPRTPRTRSMSR